MAGIQRSSAARALARKLALQALYSWQINERPWQDLVTEFATDADMPRADAGYFRALVEGVCGSHAQLDEALTPYLNVKAAQLDAIEHAVLWIAAHELRQQPEVPFRVAINEAVGLARRYGATDGHKFVNAVLDRAAREWRAHER
jgi:N utilization substance protein B